MKKKFSLWLNIATICLCVCAIAIGVYSAQSATLTVTGSVGFEAHNIEYIATARAKNYATDEEGDNFKEELTDVTKTQGTQVNNELSLIDMYFSDKSGEVPDIELEITITNNSKFAISITPVSATCTGVDITPPSATSADKDKSVTLTYTLSLQKNSSDEYDDITANTLTIEIKLERDTNTYKTDKNGNQIVVYKYTESEQSEIWNKTISTLTNWTYGYTDDSPCYATYFPYYITMGNKDGTAIRWLIVGTNNNGTVTALTTEDKAILETGKLLADTIYVALSAEVLETRQFHSTASITNNINANDYYQSDIRAYLTSTVTSGDDIGFSAKYSLTGINIEKREVKKLYVDIDVGSGGSNITEGNIEADDFWLLSKTEVQEIFNSKGYHSASVTTVMSGSNQKDWCLRSPGHDIDEVAVVEYTGNLGGH